MKSSIAREILAYLAEHPDAQDTAEGIAQWWLLERRIQQEVPQVKAALTELTESGLIRKRQGKDSSTRYRIRRSWQLHYWLKKLFARPAKAALSQRQHLTVVKLLDRFNSREVARAPMDDSLRSQLENEIRPQVEELGELLGRDCTHWCR